MNWNEFLRNNISSVVTGVEYPDIKRLVVYSPDPITATDISNIEDQGYKLLYIGHGNGRLSLTFVEV